MNKYITVWKSTMENIVKTTELLNLTEQQKQELIKQLAIKQWETLKNDRPNKNKSTYEQANEEQREYLDYLNKVIVTGEL